MIEPLSPQIQAAILAQRQQHGTKMADLVIQFGVSDQEVLRALKPTAPLVSEERVTLIRQQFRDGSKIAALARKHRISTGTVGMILYRKGAYVGGDTDMPVVQPRTIRSQRALSVDAAAALRQRYRDGETNLAALARELNLSQTTLINVLTGRYVYVQDTDLVTIRYDLNKAAPGHYSTRALKLNPQQIIKLRAQARERAQPLSTLAKQYGVSINIISSALRGEPPYNDGLELSAEEYRGFRRQFNAAQAAELRSQFREGGIVMEDLAIKHQVSERVMRGVLSCKGAYAPDDDPVEKSVFREARKLTRIPALTDNQVETIRRRYLRGKITIPELASDFKVSTNTVSRALNAKYPYESYTPITVRRGSRHRTRGFSTEQAKHIRWRRLEGKLTLDQLALEFNTSPNTIRRIVKYLGVYAVDAPSFTPPPTKADVQP